MKICYVSDNRTGSNWGCRATSIALSELIERQCSIHSSIYRVAKLTVVRVGSLLPFFIAGTSIYSRNRKPFTRRIFERVDSMLGGKDYISYDPLQSAENLLKYKHRNQFLAEIYEKVNSSDLIVINGEGDLIFNPNRRTVLFLFMIAELANLAEIPVFFVNAMISDCPRFGRDNLMVQAAIQSLGKCTGIALRDKESVSLLNEIAPHIQCTYIPDALFSWIRYCSSKNLMDIKYGSSILPYPRDYLWGRYDFSKPYICLGGSSLAVRNRNLAIEAYIKLAKHLSRLGQQVYIVDTGDGFFLEEVAKKSNLPLVPIETPILTGASILAGASLFVSGRYHPSIMASLGGTPCIFLGSNSHKTRSLQELLNYEKTEEFKAIPSDPDIHEIVARAKKVIDSGEKERQRIQSQVLRLAKESEKIIPFILDLYNNN